MTEQPASILYPDTPGDTPISNLDIPPRLRNAIRNENFSILNDLRNVPDHLLTRISGIGHDTVQQFRAAYGYPDGQRRWLDATFGERIETALRRLSGDVAAMRSEVAALAKAGRRSEADILVDLLKQAEGAVISEAKPTPGPYSLLLARNNSGDVGITAPGVGNVIAECFADMRFNGEWNHAEALANAEQFRAAPETAAERDTLRAELVKLIEAAERVEWWLCTVPKSQEIVSVLRDAITAARAHVQSKAEGL